jgi:hypothetical protein
LLVVATAAASTGAQASASAVSTEFAVRLAPGAEEQTTAAHTPPSAGTYRPLVAAAQAPRLGSAVALARSWGRVTSTVRSPSRNRAVGGVRNSYHLSGRAIDIARYRGVRHAEIDAAFRRAGYHILESLDEGDHSHFAFGWGTPAPTRVRHRDEPSPTQTAEVTRWRIVSVPRGLR